jgi:DNA invertase Pin-like site-specific DNA recombinase
MPIAVGLVRVSTEEQANSGLGLAAQRVAIAAEIDRRGWTLAEIFEDRGVTGGRMDGRAGLAAALAFLKAKQAEILIVSKLDRLSRSVGDLAHILALASRQKWALVALDVGIDTTSPSGEAMAFVLGTFSQMERRLIGQRTKEALLQAKARGVQLGSPIAVPPEVEARIVRRRYEGATLQTIADELTGEGIPTPRKGSEWRHATIRTILSRHAVPSYPRGRRRRIDSHK